MINQQKTPTHKQTINTHWQYVFSETLLIIVLEI